MSERVRWIGQESKKRVPACKDEACGRKRGSGVEVRDTGFETAVAGSLDAMLVKQMAIFLR